MDTNVSVVPADENPWSDVALAQQAAHELTIADDDEPTDLIADQPDPAPVPTDDDQVPADGEDEDELELDDLQPPEAQVPSPSTQLVNLEVPPQTGQPFAFKADGTAVAVPGAVRYANGVWIPAEAWPTMQRHLADRTVWAQTVAKFHQQHRELADAFQQYQADTQHALTTHPTILQAQALLAEWTAVMNGGAEKVAEWLEDFERNRPILEAKAQATAEKMRADAVTAREQQRQAAEQQAARQRDLAPKLDKLLVDNVAFYATQAAYQVLAPAAVQQEVLAALNDPAIKPGLFVTADRDLPEIRMRAGDVDVNRPFLESLLKQQVALRSRLVARTKAERHNAAVLGQRPRNAPPPSARVSSGVPETGVAAIPVFKTKAEFDYWSRTGKVMEPK